MNGFDFAAWRYCCRSGRLSSWVFHRRTELIANRSVDSISSFITHVSDFAKCWRQEWKEKSEKEDYGAADWLPWFRGEETAAWFTGTALQPKLYRNTADIKKVLRLEQEMRMEFRRCGVQLITERPPVDKWEWYFLMQHHRAPTRLLDWSDAALVALYFAVASRGDKNDKHGVNDATVYMLDPWWLNEQAFKKICTVAESDQPRGTALPDWDEAKHYLPDELNSEQLGLSARWRLILRSSHVALPHNEAGSPFSAENQTV
jgi:hypothetical protein